MNHAQLPSKNAEYDEMLITQDVYVPPSMRIVIAPALIAMVAVVAVHFAYEWMVM